MSNNKVGVKSIDKLSRNINRVASDTVESVSIVQKDSEIFKKEMEEADKNKIAKEKENKKVSLNIEELKNAPRIIIDER